MLFLCGIFSDFEGTFSAGFLDKRPAGGLTQGEM